MSLPLKVAWISDFPLEWLPDKPSGAPELPRGHAMSWQRVLLDELRRQPDLDLHIFILRKQVPRDQVVRWGSITFHLLKMPGYWRAPSLFWVDIWRLRPLLRELCPDVVHAWGIEKGAGLVAQRLGWPSLLTVQGLMTWYAEVAEINLYSRFVAMVERWTMPRARWVTTESNFAVRYIQEKFPGPQVRRIEHAPDWMFHRLTRQPQADPVRFLYVGSLEPRKGTDLLLRALDALTGEFPFELVMVGRAEGNYAATLRQTGSPALWQRIQWREHLSPAEVAGELARATMLLFPTRADTSPNAVKEAAVAGLPVVASAVGGIPDYIIPNENGLLFPSGDQAAFTQAIRAALAHPQFRQGRVDAARLQAVRQYLSPALMASEFLKLYQEVAEKTG